MKHHLVLKSYSKGLNTMVLKAISLYNGTKTPDLNTIIIALTFHKCSPASTWTLEPAESEP